MQRRNGKDAASGPIRQELCYGTHATLQYAL